MQPYQRPRPVLVGEANPYGADPRFALYPAPDGSSGHRLCCLILGMTRAAYLRSFDRVNLCPQEWDAGAAKLTVHELLQRPGRNRLILLGSKVCRAFGVKYEPFGGRALSHRTRVVILPHPSGRNQTWNSEANIQLARATVNLIAPELNLLSNPENGDEYQPRTVDDDGVSEGE